MNKKKTNKRWQGVESSELTSSHDNDKTEQGEHKHHHQRTAVVGRGDASVRVTLKAAADALLAVRQTHARRSHASQVRVDIAKRLQTKQETTHERNKLHPITRSRSFADVTATAKLCTLSSKLLFGSIVTSPGC